MKDYKIGSGVWYSQFQTHEVKVPCPVCFGDKHVIVILGNGEEVQVECDYCGKGWQCALGYVTEYVQEPRVEYLIITKKRIDEGVNGKEIEYQSEHTILREDRMFDTEQEALDYAIILADESNARKSAKYKNEKSYSWNAGYHMKAAKKSREEAEYHEEKAKICKSKSKGE